MTNYRAGRPDKRGNNRDRAARKLYLLSAPQFGGDGTHVYCVHGCGTLLDYETVEADRIEPGESYRRNNVQPACRPCNIARSNNPYWIFTPPEY
jgi:5-methylcytosine-specific restriction endonuclease McrA